MINHQDVIFALATPHGISALHLHRVSGNGLFQKIAPYLFELNGFKNLELEKLILESNMKPVTRYAILKNIQNEILDDIVFTCFQNPKSYTGEDILEITSHGNPLISNIIHSFLRSLGFRDAQPGEFTSRALFNGKLDLTQAEGINQLIHAESYGSIELARNNMSGLLSKETVQIRNELIEILAYLEAHIDFAPDEVGDYEPQQFLDKTHLVQFKLRSLLNSYENGLKIKDGLKLILCGKPNSGKSSLYNAFLKQDKAIVTSIAGTTRDILEEKLWLDKKEFILLDTAGLRNTQDEVEKIGVSKTLQNIKDAKIVCYLISISQLSMENYKYEIQTEINDFLKISALNLKEQKLILVLNKTDIIPDLFLKELGKLNFVTLNRAGMDPVVSAMASPRDDDLLDGDARDDAFREEKLEKIPIVLNSEKNFNDLKFKLIEYYNDLYTQTDLKNSPILISQRQKDKVQGALKIVFDVEKLIQLKDYPEKIASLIISTKILLEEIVGEINIDQVFEKVFSTFCIGK